MLDLRNSLNGGKKIQSEAHENGGFLMINARCKGKKYFSLTNLDKLE